ncbi:MAG: hypothetical protein RJA10_3607 [Pseudomonadota bacterium]|jgi:glycosyltransferase involved in cell wall biosynthesis
MTTTADPRPRVLLVTEVDFWLGGAGHRARIGTLVAHLAPRVRLTVLVPPAWPADRWAQARAACPGVDLQSLNLPARVVVPQARAALHAFLQQRPQHACIVEYLSLGWLRAAVPAGVLTLVDTHDVASQRDADFLRAGRTPPWPLTREDQERARLAAFDRVIAISAPDAEVFTRWLGADRVLLVPHPCQPSPQPVREHASRVLFVGSAYLPNRDGLAWLLREVWPRVGHAGAVLDLVGDAAQGLGATALPPSVHLHGRMPDLAAAYAQADLCVNPVAYGSGLKIKSVEALAHGRPLVCTTAGSRGLPADGEGAPAWVTADDPAAFATAIDTLLASHRQRRHLAAAGLALVARHFDAERCFQPLLHLLQAAAGGRTTG